MNTPRLNNELPPSLKPILDDMLEDSAAALKSLFTACDTLFLDLSNRANSDHEMNLYYDAKKELLEFEQDIIQTYHKGIVWNFILAVNGKDLPHTNKQKHVERSELKLIDNDQLEVDISINNMASSIRNSYYDDLKALRIRLDHLIPTVSISTENNPFDPFHIGHAFSFACQKHMTLDVKSLVIIFKQYERYVLNQLGHNYTAANTQFIEGNILPNIPEALLNSPKPKNIISENTPPAIPNRYTPEEAQFNMGYIASLFAIARSNSHKEFELGDIAEASAYPLTNYSQFSGPIMATNDLLSNLPNAQAQPMADKPSLSNYISKFVHILLSKGKASEPQSVSEVDDNTINLVSMFFDFILDDPAIATTIKVQIGRLQIPILKSALKDRLFFSSSAHPGRTLLNTIAAIGIRFDDDTPKEKDRIYKAICHIATNIVANYHGDDKAFSNANDELQAVIAKEARKSDIIEQRTEQAEAGRAKLKMAKSVVKSLLIEKLSNTNIPEQVQTFMTSTWLNVLIMTHLKKGTGSVEWVDASQTIDDLLWVCQPHSSSRSINRINEFKISLISRLQEGMELINEHENDQSNRLAYFEKLLHLAGQSIIDKEPLKSNSPSVIREAIVANDSDLADEQEPESYKELTFENLQSADKVQIGTWLKYRTKNSDEYTRCKLSTKLSDTNTFIFVNRYGFKAFEKPRKEFALDIQEKRVEILDDTPLFERATININRTLFLVSSK